MKIMQVKRIPYGKGNYYISDKGEVFNSETGLKLKNKAMKSGYEEIMLHNSGESKSFLIHRLVANAFLSGNGEEVNHKNGIKNDNRVENLEWCTHGENLKHAFENGLRADDVAPRKIIATNSVNGEETRFPSIYKAARFLGISQGNICMCCKGIRPMANGYLFRYADITQTGGE